MNAALRLLLCTFAFIGCGGGASHPILVLITIDTLRADHLGAYGGPPGISPNIDAIAAQSVRFESAYAPASYTLPSVASLLSGLYPEEVGILDNVNLFKPSGATLAEVLRLSGWRTGAAVSNHVLRSGTGIEQGFDLYDDALSEIEVNRGTPERTARRTTAAALDVLDGLLERPGSGVFLWVHYQDPHGPYLPPDERRDRFLDAARRATDGKRVLPTRGVNPMGAIPDYQLVGDEREVAFYRAGYAAEVQFVDEEIGALRAAIEDRGLWEDAVVALTADHGESLGEDDYWFAHGAFLSDALVRVPLLIRKPGTAGSVRSDVASIVDLMPTLLARFGIDVPGTFSGRDLFAEGAAESGGRAYLATLLGGDVKRHGWVEDGYKYVLSRGPQGAPVEELHEIAPGDPNASPPNPAQMREQRARLESFRDQLDIADAVQQELSPRDREMLRRLGYLE